MANDMRGFIESLREAGELVEVNHEVDWNFEIPAYEVLSGRFGGPAFLFNKIKGIPEGPKVLAAPFVGTFYRPHKKAALALGIDPNLDRTRWVQELGKRMAAMMRPVEVSTGSCKEVVKMGKDVNLLEFPFTYHAIGDGGRYIFISAAVIKDPDSDWINTGNYAIGVFSRNRLVITPYAHTNFLAIYSNKYELRGNSMPVAVCIGGDPAVTMAAGMILPPGISEYDIAGGIRGTPMELVRAETSDLLVPANAEVVIEGEIRPYERLPEGPKIEVFGFSVGPRQPFYPIRVHCITHRKNPVIWDVHTAMGTSAPCLQESLANIAFLGQVKAFGLPFKVGDSLAPTRNGATSQVAIYKKKYPEDYPGFMRDVFDKYMGLPGLGGVFAKEAFVDDDVNVLDIGDFYDAFFTQVNPAKDIHKSNKMTVMTIESSWMEEWDRDKYMGPGGILGTKQIYDATTKEAPPLGVRRLNFETIYPESIQKWVVENWKRMGFKEEPRWNKSYLDATF